MQYRTATAEDTRLLAEMNQQLIRNERHRNPMTLEQLKQRMTDWLSGEYEAVIFEDGEENCGYVLFRREAEWVYVRQFWVREKLRRRGIGRRALEWLIRNRWTGAPRIRLDVLIQNTGGLAFWRAVGFRDYCLTLERTLST